MIRARQEWGRKISHQPGSWHWTHLSIEDQDRENLHAMCDWLLNDTRERRMTIAGSWFYTYTNDITLLQDMAALPWLNQDRMSLTQICTVGQPNTVRLKTSNYSKRTYFRSLLMDEGQSRILKNLLNSQEHVRLSPGLKYWMTRDRWTRTFDYHFIDHDDDGIITMLALLSPRLIRRTLPIVADK